MNRYQAYLLGAYLTDGCISKTSHEWKCFTLEVIDKEFSDKVLECINQLTEMSGRQYERIGKNGKLLYKTYCGDQNLCIWLIESTSDKLRIPIEVWNAPIGVKREFVAGMMDGDGYISKYKNGWLGVMGFAVNDLWVFEFWELLNKMGVQTSRPKPETKNRKNTLYRFRINKTSFINAGLYFTIRRKQERLDSVPQRLHAKNPSGL